MNAQAQYEIDEADNLEQAKEYRRQGHTLQCAATMAWKRQKECSCEMERWNPYDEMER